MNKCLYKVTESNFENPLEKQALFQLHSHDEYEIYMFLEGDTKYIVEEKNYTLSHGDVILIRKHEMHRAFHASNKHYKSFVLWINPQFFTQDEMTEFEEAFLENKFAPGNKISSETVRESGLYDAIMRLRKYMQSGEQNDSVIIRSVVTEIVYLINKISSFEGTEAINKPVKKIINYINSHYTSEITLNTLCENFFISKYHLCRIFKDATGLTISEYIRQKRLTHVESLRREGKSLTEASIEAGFGDYSSFYRAYVKKNKKGPTL